MHDPTILMRAVRVGVDRMLSRCYANGIGNMHGDGNKMISKTFRKPRRVPLMPEGDDDELGNHLIKKWRTGASECVVFESELV